jgi:ATP-dependent RNA helicase DDX24/MAK5
MARSKNRGANKRKRQQQPAGGAKVTQKVQDGTTKAAEGTENTKDKNTKKNEHPVAAGGRIWQNKALPWRSISLEENDEGTTASDRVHEGGGKKSKRVLDYNHYDAEHLEHGGKGRYASKELQTDDNTKNNMGMPSSENNAMAMLFGFEVLDADSYKIETSTDSSGGVFTTVVPTTVIGPGSETGSTGPGDEETEIKTEKKRNNKRSNKKSKTKIAADKVDAINASGEMDVDPELDDSASDNHPKSKNSKSKKSESKKTKTKTKDDVVKEVDDNDTKLSVLLDMDNLKVEPIQSQWNGACGFGALLHPVLCHGLSDLGYDHPMPIQAATLPAAMLGRRNIVGAAPTGSGKTLAYALPILQHIFQKRDKERDSNTDSDADKNEKDNNSTTNMLQGLIICPTRELALQVQKEISVVSCHQVQCVALVGGLAMQKQTRLLNSKAGCDIVVATPGRLWELMSSGDYDILNSLHKLQFLVLDEADRMIRPGSFPQLKAILKHVCDNETEEEEEEEEKEALDVTQEEGDGMSIEDMEEEEEEEEEDDEVSLSEDQIRELMPGLAGIPGEAKLTMLDDSILRQIDEQRQEPAPTPKEVKQIKVYAGKKNRKERGNSNSNGGGGDGASLKKSGAGKPDLPRQTFIYSATLTLPSMMTGDDKAKKQQSQQHSQKNKKKNKHKNTRPNTVEGAIAEMLELAGATGHTKVVDLTSANEISNLDANVDAKNAKNEKGDTKEGDVNKATKQPVQASSQRLPGGLTVLESQCILKHKDTQVYAYLTTTKEGARGPSLVFCNSIEAVRRVTETLRVLGLPAKAIHAQMPQKMRFKALETLKASNSRAVVVATDVAARGLDIPAVSSVIHYDVARGVDTFVHRAGRTARANSTGTSVSLVCPAEDSKHKKIYQMLYGPKSKGFETLQLDGRLLTAAHARASLSAKIVAYEDKQAKVQKNKSWFKSAGEEAGIDISDDDDDDLQFGGVDPKVNHCRSQEIKQAKGQLRSLLAKPMRKQHYGKFLSGAGVREAIAFEQQVEPHVVVGVGSSKRP